MKKNKNRDDTDISELKELIHEEKEEALLGFRKEDFKIRLDERIDAEPQRTLRDIFWFRKPVIAAVTVLFIIILGWVAARVFAPDPCERDARAIEKILAQAVEVHELLAAQRVPQIEPKPGSDDLYEFEWSLKRVAYSVQREDIPDSDIPRIFSQVLQNVTQAKETENNEPLGLNPESKNGISLKENNLSQMLYKIQD